MYHIELRSIRPHSSHTQTTVGQNVVLCPLDKVLNGELCGEWCLSVEPKQKCEINFWCELYVWFGGESCTNKDGHFKKTAMILGLVHTTFTLNTMEEDHSVRQSHTGLQSLLAVWR